MSLDKHSFRPLTPLLLRGMFEHAKPDAPWLAADPDFRNFLAESLAGGAQWLVDEKALREHLVQPAHATFCVKLRSRLAPIAEFEEDSLGGRARRVFAQSLYGVAQVQEHYVGNWRYPDSESERHEAIKSGDEDRYYCSTPQPSPPSLDALIPVLNHFWSDIPAYLVDKVGRHLVQREEFTERGWGGNSEYLLDTVDAGKCFHALAAANRLMPNPGPDLAQVFAIPTPAAPAARPKVKV